MKIDKCGFIVGAMMLTSLGLQSCQEEDISLTETRYPILFSTVDTRAVAGIDDLKENGFKVYAHLKGNTGEYATFEKDVTYSHQDVWGYTGLEYWIPGVSYWFTAFYPKDGYFSIYNTSSDQAYTVSNYDITSQVDLMVAKANCSVAEDKLTPEGGRNVVNLSFNHLLACVVIEIKSAIDGVTIENITLDNVADHGKYGNDGTWSSSNTGSITCNSGVSLTKGSEYADVTKGGILVLPVDKGTVSLTIKAMDKTYSAELSPEIWEKGKKYTYTAEIKQNDIIFNDPSADIWDSESATGSVIIK
ncbi:MAG: fimbrillin family protein [Bacteroidaceae bacterium]|nr:fimbrillin family protein [Bacteroidaceae bacterium]